MMPFVEGKDRHDSLNINGIDGKVGSDDRHPTTNTLPSTAASDSLPYSRNLSSIDNHTTSDTNAVLSEVTLTLSKHREHTQEKEETHSVTNAFSHSHYETSKPDSRNSIIASYSSNHSEKQNIQHEQDQTETGEDKWHAMTIQNDISLCPAKQLQQAKENANNFVNKFVEDRSPENTYQQQIDNHSKNMDRLQRTQLSKKAQTSSDSYRDFSSLKTSASADHRNQTSTTVTTVNTNQTSNHSMYGNFNHLQQQQQLNLSNDGTDVSTHPEPHHHNESSLFSSWKDPSQQQEQEQNKLKQILIQNQQQHTAQTSNPYPFLCHNHQQPISQQLQHQQHYRQYQYEKQAHCLNEPQYFDATTQQPLSSTGNDICNKQSIVLLVQQPQLSSMLSSSFRSNNKYLNGNINSHQSQQLHMDSHNPHHQRESHILSNVPNEPSRLFEETNQENTANTTLANQSFAADSHVNCQSKLYTSLPDLKHTSSECAPRFVKEGIAHGAPLLLVVGGGAPVVNGIATTTNENHPDAFPTPVGVFQGSTQKRETREEIEDSDFDGRNVSKLRKIEAKDQSTVLVLRDILVRSILSNPQWYQDDYDMYAVTEPEYPSMSDASVNKRKFCNVSTSTCSNSIRNSKSHSNSAVTKANAIKTDKSNQKNGLSGNINNNSRDERNNNGYGVTTCTAIGYDVASSLLSLKDSSMINTLSENRKMNCGGTSDNDTRIVDGCVNRQQDSRHRSCSTTFSESLVRNCKSVCFSNCEDDERTASDVLTMSKPKRSTEGYASVDVDISTVARLSSTASTPSLGILSGGHQNNTRLGGRLNVVPPEIKKNCNGLIRESMSPQFSSLQQRDISFGGSSNLNVPMGSWPWQPLKRDIKTHNQLFNQYSNVVQHNNDCRLENVDIVNNIYFTDTIVTSPAHAPLPNVQGMDNLVYPDNVSST